MSAFGGKADSPKTPASIRADLGPQGTPLRDKCDFVPSDANFFAIVAMSGGTRSRFPNFHVKRHRLTSDDGDTLPAERFSI